MISLHSICDHRGRPNTTTQSNQDSEKSQRGALIMRRFFTKMAPVTERSRGHLEVNDLVDANRHAVRGSQRYQLDSRGKNCSLPVSHRKGASVAYISYLSITTPALSLVGSP
jgi:hypothetical protein